MKKWPSNLLLCAGICAVLMIGASLISCAKDQAEESETNTEANSMPSGGGEAPQSSANAPQDDTHAPQNGKRALGNDGSILAKITSITDDIIEIVVAEQPKEQMTPPEAGEQPPQQSENGAEAFGKPEAEMKFSEEAIALTLSSDTVITKGVSREEVSVSSLSEGDIIKIVLDGTAALRIEVMEPEAEEQ